MNKAKKIVQNYRSLDDVSSELIRVIQKLSLAHSLDDITTTVRTSARNLVHADGATFVLRDEEQCHYVDEDAISSLWKGMKFPLKACISGWSMLHNEQVTIEDIYQDERIPHDAYKPTFVKSLTITPIRKEEPIGAIGTYWAKNYTPTKEELEALQALADTTSIAIKNVNTLEKLKKRTENLERINQRLNRFTWIVSHDLKEPLRSISLNLSMIEEELINNESISKDYPIYKYIEKINKDIKVSEQLITDLLDIAKLENHERSISAISLENVVKEVLLLFETTVKGKKINVEYKNLPIVRADPVLITRVFQNIISNSIKFQKNNHEPKIIINAEIQGPHWVVSIEDNGIGIPKDYHEKVFDFFSHIHNRIDFPGSGVGLSICKMIIKDFGGKIWIDPEYQTGCRIYFTLPRDIDERF